MVGIPDGLRDGSYGTVAKENTRHSGKLSNQSLEIKQRKRRVGFDIFHLVIFNIARAMPAMAFIKAMRTE